MGLTGRCEAVDADARRRECAQAFGARVFERIDACDSRAYEIIVDAGGDAALLLEALRRAAPEAIVTSVAPAVIGPQLPSLELYMKGLTYKIGRPNCRAGHDGALHAWSACGFSPARVQPLIRPFETACETWCDPALFVAVTTEQVRA